MINKVFFWVLPLLLLTVAVEARVPDFADLVAQNSSAVVKVSTVQKKSANMPALPPGQEIPDILRKFFDQYKNPDDQAFAMGSGFIISPDGYVITNNHVIEGADEITVRLIDRRELAAKVIGADPRSDLALLKVDSEEALPAVTFAPAHNLRVGEWVIAIGSPFGLDYSASVGIVSAIGRSLPTQQGENYVPFIQSDVAINPGNSGGPLFNQNGEVVGINSQIYTRSGGSIGVSFAIPVAVATDVIAQLKANGRVERGWLGVHIQDVDRDLAESLGLAKPVGALVSQVFADSPAEEAGFKAGDVIVRFNGKEVVESGDLPHQVGLLAPGTRVEAEIIRNGKAKTLNVEVGRLPEADEPVIAQSDSADALGLRVVAIETETAQKLKISGGVVIESVRPGSPAQYTELQPGDIIVQLGNSPVKSIADYEKILKTLPSGVPVLVRFLRQGQFIYRTLEISP
ncbi:MAG: DegQ family serine endoprotease [Porticoccaceae bacterium]|nr:DegQ family serine endoprotease [Porticoccaceae bacterium]